MCCREKEREGKGANASRASTSHRLPHVIHKKHQGNKDKISDVQVVRHQLQVLLAATETYFMECRRRGGDGWS